MVATSRDQSKHLLELGLDPNTADMYYTGHRSIFNPKEIEYTQEPRFALSSFLLTAWKCSFQLGLCKHCLI